jgi:hypothetical protein
MVGGARCKQSLCSHFTINTRTFRPTLTNSFSVRATNSKPPIRRDPLVRFVTASSLFQQKCCPGYLECETPNPTMPTVRRFDLASCQSDHF